MFSLLRHELRIRRGAIIGWSIGLTVFVAYIVFLYPEIQPMLARLDLTDIPIYQAMAGQIANLASLSGYLNVYLMAYLPLILSIYAIVNGTGTLAGVEDNGTLEIPLSLPLARWQIVVAKALALAAGLFLVLLLTGLVAAAALAAISDQVGPTDIAPADVALAVLGAWPLTLFFGQLSLFLGAYLPSRRLAAVVATVVLIATYFANNLAGLSDGLERLQALYPFHYFDGRQLLSEGIDLDGGLTLLGAGLFCLLLALVAFERRNVTVGAWPWQRPRPA
ncbi:MAG: ABC transporter permease subunit [Candidatus Promineifilaceae bacterium]